MKRFLKDIYQIDEEVYALVIKEAVRLDLIQNPDLWQSFNLSRNYTSDNYLESGAKYSYSQAELFLPEVRYLLNKLVEINTKLND